MLKNWCVQRRFYVCALSVLLLIGVIGVAGLNAQTAGTATVQGTVTDASGAAVAGAMVTVKNTDTGVTNMTVTDNQGRYTVPELIIGNYEVDVEATGFKKNVHGGIVLSVGAVTVVDAPLEVGTVSQTVTVESDVSHVETTSAAISSLVEQKQLVDLPLNGRDIVNLVALEPGVVPTAATGGSFYGNQSNNAIGGYRPSGTAYLLDDTYTLGWWGHAPGNGSTGTTLGIDSIAEFQTLTNTYSAQFGGAGAAVNQSSKSGTNSFHGTAYEFIRNTAVEAENLYTPTATPLPAPVLYRNQFGASIGGPIKKNKMFFFANYEGLRIAQSSFTSTSTPDLASRGCSSVAQATADNGFCALNAQGATGLVPVVNGTAAPLVGCGVGGFPASAYSNGDPCSAQKAIAAAFSLLPWQNQFNDNTTTGEATVYTQSPTYTKESYLLARFDYTLSNKDTFFARYLGDTGTVRVVGNELQDSICSTPCGLIPNVEVSSDNFGTIEERHIFSPALLNTIHFSFTRPNDDATQYASPTVPASMFGSFSNCGGCPPQQPLWFFPPELGGETGSLGGVLTGATSTEPYYLVPNGFRTGDDVVWTKGAHSFKFGAEIDRIRDNSFAPFTSGGSFTFGNLGGAFQAAGTLPGFLAGYASSSGSEEVPAALQLAEGQAYPDATKDYREMQYAFYVEDAWKMTNHLTTTLGLRYDPTNDAPIQPNHPTTNTFGAFSNLQGTDPQCAADLATTGAYLLDCGFVPVSKVFEHNVSLKNIDPRIGIAWDPFKDHKTSARAGFGITHAVLSVREWNYWLQPPYTPATEQLSTCALSGTGVITPTNSVGGVGTKPNTCQAGTPYGYPFAFAIPPAQLCNPNTSLNSSGCTSPVESTDYTKCCTPYVAQWNATVQREVMRNTVVSLGYVGSRGVHLLAENDFNPITPCGGTDPVTGLPIYVNRASPLNSALPGFSGTAWINCPRTNPAYGALNYETNQEIPGITLYKRVSTDASATVSRRRFPIRIRRRWTIQRRLRPGWRWFVLQPAELRLLQGCF